jgi:hypothetical protein
MGVWYSMEGTVKVRPCEEVQEIVERFNGESGTELTASYGDNGDGTAEVEFSGGIRCSIGTPDELDTIAKELGPYTLEPAMLTTNLDDEEIRMFIGKDEDKTATESNDTLEEIKGLLQYLTPDDKGKLKALLEG